MNVETWTNSIVYSTGRVAKICKVAPRTVSKWFDSGLLKGYRIPGSEDRRIPHDNLLKFLIAHNFPPSVIHEIQVSSKYHVLVVGAATYVDVVWSEYLQDLPIHKQSIDNWYDAGRYVVSAPLVDCVIVDLAFGRAEAVANVGRMKKDLRFYQTRMIAVAAEDEVDFTDLLNGTFHEAFPAPLDVRGLAARITELAAERSAIRTQPHKEKV